MPYLGTFSSVQFEICELCDDDINESNQSQDQIYIEATPGYRRKPSLTQ